MIGYLRNLTDGTALATSNKSLMSSVSGVFIVVVMRGMWVKSQELYFYFIFLNFSLIINHSITSIIIDKIFFDFEFGGRRPRLAC